MNNPQANGIIDPDRLDKEARAKRMATANLAVQLTTALMGSGIPQKYNRVFDDGGCGAYEDFTPSEVSAYTWALAESLIDRIDQQPQDSLN